MSLDLVGKEHESTRLFDAHVSQRAVCRSELPLGLERIALGHCEETNELLTTDDECRLAEFLRKLQALLD